MCCDFDVVAELHHENDGSMSPILHRGHFFYRWKYSFFFFFFPTFFFFFQHKEKFAKDLFSERPLFNLRAAKQLRKAFAIGTKVKTNYTKEMIMDMKQARRDRYVYVYLGILVVYLCVCVLTFFSNRSPIPTLDPPPVEPLVIATHFLSPSQHSCCCSNTMFNWSSC